MYMYLIFNLMFCYPVCQAFIIQAKLWFQALPFPIILAFATSLEFPCGQPFACTLAVKARKARRRAWCEMNIESVRAAVLFCQIIEGPLAYQWARQRHVRDNDRHAVAKEAFNVGVIKAPPFDRGIHQPIRIWTKSSGACRHLAWDGRDAVSPTSPRRAC